MSARSSRRAAGAPEVDGLPRLRSRNAPLSPKLRAVLDIEIPDSDAFSVAFGPSDHTALFIDATDEELLSATDLRQAPSRETVVSQETLTAMLNGLSALGFVRLHRSTRDRQPVAIDELRRDEAAQEKLCRRDEECVGSAHIWLTVVSDEQFVPIWHINLGNGRVVPPAPLLAECE